MLVLDRRVQEGFWIDDRIYVKVLSIGRQRVKLGIQAPLELRVVREELTPPDGGGRPAAGRPAEQGTEGSFRPVRR